MLEDGKEQKPAIYLVIDKNNKVLAYCSVNVAAPTLIREDEHKELFDKMMDEGANVLADPTKNFVINLGLQNKKKANA